MKRLWIIAAMLGGLAATNTASAAAQPICMSKVVNNNEANRLTILVPSIQKQQVTQRGFLVEPCAGKDNNPTDYRDKICTLAQRSARGFKQAFFRETGISPDELCTMAQDILSH